MLSHETVTGSTSHSDAIAVTAIRTRELARILVVATGLVLVIGLAIVGVLTTHLAEILERGQRPVSA